MPKLAYMEDDLETFDEWLTRELNEALVMILVFTVIDVGRPKWA